MKVTEWNIWMLLGLIAVVVAGRYLFETLLSRSLKAIGVASRSTRFFIMCIIMIVFNIIVLLLFGLLSADLVALANMERGLIFVAVGFVVALLVSLLSYFAIKSGYGEGYGEMIGKSPLEQVFSVVTYLVLVGLAEDLFFVGFAQNLLVERMGWGSIVIYVALFPLYHFANVIRGVEKKKEFLGTLPVRLLVATLLAVSFYSTRSLIYGIVIHNAVDTLTYIALVLGVKQMRESTEPAE
jgi:membrane protease YdiL (CAAX protease family)